MEEDVMFPIAAADHRRLHALAARWTMTPQQALAKLLDEAEHPPLPVMGFPLAPSMDAATTAQDAVIYQTWVGPQKGP
jgi:hypothetical protein